MTVFWPLITKKMFSILGTNFMRKMKMEFQPCSICRRFIPVSHYVVFQIATILYCLHAVFVGFVEHVYLYLSGHENDRTLSGNCCCTAFVFCYGFFTKICVWCSFCSGITLDEYSNFWERIKDPKLGYASNDTKELIRHWVSYRGQTLSRTGVNCKLIIISITNRCSL